MKSPLRFGRALWRLLVLAALVGGANLFVRSRRSRSGALETYALCVFHAVARRLVGLLGVEVERSGHVPDGLCVVVANHRSYVDIPLVMAEIPSRFLAKREIANWPFFGASASLCGTVFVDREDRASRQRALESLDSLLDAGHRIMVFPEGTTSTGPGCLPFRSGVFRLAAARGLPVVPVAIAYRDVRDAWVDDMSFVGHFLARFSQARMRVAVTVGPPIRGEDAVVLKHAAEAWIVERLALCDEAREAPAETALLLPTAPVRWPLVRGNLSPGSLLLVFRSLCRMLPS
jgi:lyso-ornithine lipid O-acyltransferase